MLADELGLSLGFILIGGQTNDCTQSIPLLGERRPGRAGEPRATIRPDPQPPRRTRHPCRYPGAFHAQGPTRFDRTLYRQRNRIERTFAHLKEFRRLVTRFDKLKQNFQATVVIACTLRWLRQYVDIP
jgi:transposase